MKIDCIEVTRRIDDEGYGRIQRGQRELKAHRVAWESANGPIPDGLCVLHKCDNRKCVNVEHLWLGTRGDNNRDREAKGRGRQPKGQDSSNARITEQTAIRIKMIGDLVSQQSIADCVGMTQAGVGKILIGRSWRHITAQTRYAF